ncbi:hypothetical protein [Hyphomicrobium sp. D-2]|uniref:hypothetical protein n=1 Tax=Hyphomicrobium sp. D-2 TaxID=3041621 RepID=UPI0024575D4F|nr:hypothetical protein [Hyphomicrobium sp. D-2]MDH4983957.1 hypothetical protein [Hyphomicrobium sp. D-2]
MSTTDTTAAPASVAAAPGLSPEEARLQRTMKIVVVALGVLLFAGLAAIAGRIIYLASARDAQPSVVAVQPPAPRLAVPPGAGAASDMPSGAGAGAATGDAATVPGGVASAAHPGAASAGASSAAHTARLPATVAPLSLPVGAVIRSVSISGDRLAVHFEGAGAEGIAVYDLASGRPLTIVDVTRAPD